MSSSLFAQYIYERSNKSIIEDENGFATFYFINDICYIEDIYVKSDMRKHGIASKYADTILAQAKLKGAKKLMGSVNLKANNPTTSMKVLLAYGFDLAFNDNQMIYLQKEVI